MPRDCLRIIESKSKVRNSRNKPVVAKVSTSNSTPGISPDVAELKDMVKALLLDKKNQSQAPATVKAVEENCVTCGGAHSHRNCPATDGNIYRDNIQEYVSQAAVANFNQGNTSYRPPIANQIRPPGFPPVQQNQGNNQNRYNQNRGNNYNQGPIYQPPVNQAPIYRPPINQPPAYQAPAYQAPAPQTQGVSKEDFQNYIKANDARNHSKKLTLKAITTRSGVSYNGTQVPPPPSSLPKVVEHETEPVVAPVSAPKPNSKPLIPYPSRLNDQKIPEKANNQIEKFYQIFPDFHFDISFVDALIRMHKFASTLKSLISNKEKLMDECLALADLGASINLMPLSVWKKISLPELTPTCMALELADRYSSNYDDNLVNRIDVIDMACEEYSQEVLGFSNVIASGNLTPYYDPIISTSSPSLTPFGDSDFLLEEVDAFLALEDDPTSPEGDDKLPVIIAKDLSVEEKSALIKVLKSRKRAIAWKLSDIKGINLKFCTHKILMEEDYKPAVQHQRWVNLKIHDVIKKEVEKLLDAGLIYPISDSPWLNEASRKDHFPLPFMDQMLEILAGNDYYCFLDGFSGYFQIPIDPKDQEKTTFTCPYGTFAYRRMPFSLCNAPGTFQRCMLAIFHDMVEKMMEVFMDDFSVFGNSFENYLSRFDKMLQRCEDTKLCLNWEKSHFMVKEGIVLGHKISKNGIKVDKAKVDVIAKLPHPTTVKGVRSFLGHAGFYRRFIKDFSKISRPMTHLLEKNTPFIFSNECIQAFNTLKKKLTEAPILIAPDWDLPFELMCDASDFAIGAVLGQRHEKHFKPIHYASKTMNEAESHYTTTEKEMLAVVWRTVIGHPIDGSTCERCGNDFEMDIAFYAIQGMEILSLMIRLRILSIILLISHTHLHNPNTCHTLIPICYDDDDEEESSIPLRDIIISELPPCIAITPVLFTEEPDNSLSMGDEHLSAIPKNKETSVEDLV
ncbi:reverse transcriptase domain-containing protein [Tanacetum coccineum]|uniref:Reverse transcriptase domain-containing protein n=1 Tax=Tanacetum coccineum TaxID=301880 RepID=A0ABQ5FLJ9_9ASTR